MGLAPEDVDYSLAGTGTELVAGRLPMGSRRKIALQDAVMRNKGLTIGDEFGRDLDPNEPLRFWEGARAVRVWDGRVAAAGSQ